MTDNTMTINTQKRTTDCRLGIAECELRKFLDHTDCDDQTLRAVVGIISEARHWIARDLGMEPKETTLVLAAIFFNGSDWNEDRVRDLLPMWSKVLDGGEDWLEVEFETDLSTDDLQALLAKDLRTEEPASFEFDRKRSIELDRKDDELHRCFVLLDTGNILVQVPDDSEHGFHLADDEGQTWEGDCMPSSRWEALAKDDPRITDEIREAYAFGINFDA